MKPLGDQLILRTVYLSLKLDRRLKQVAFREGVTKNEIIRRLLTKALEEDQNAP